ncbi:MAG: flavin reductase family protein [Gemmatimonadetes bacterium]|nr:flavin reductase family protein [Gemmatimonadota bacterium]MCY3678347.1 flavin reductase family protein [Gemmatimonadota bacterium]MYA43654.1 flavin reductase family protein [Gemmatimonadota bacterium]
MTSAPGWSRRRFLENGPAAAAITAVWGCTPDEPTQADGSRPSAPLTAPRRPLALPGPMLPPVPAILLTVNGRPGDPDEISVLWTFVVNGDPPQIGVSAGLEHQARTLLELHDEFVLNVPVASMVEAFDTVDMNSSRVADKFELSGLTRGAATVVDAPTLAESPIHCECRIIDSLEVPPERKLFIAEVVATTVIEGVVDDDDRLIVPAVDFFGMTAGSGEHYTMGRRVGNIGMTVGRSDIRY